MEAIPKIMSGVYLTGHGGLEKLVYKEDIFVVEGMQKGRYANGFDGGRFSPVMDEPTHVFHDWYARKILNSF